MNGNQKAFGKLGNTSKAGSTVMPASGHTRGWTTYAFYGVVACLFLFAAATLSHVFEDPNVRAVPIAEAQGQASERETAVAAARAKEEVESKEAARIAAMPPLKVNSWNCTTDYGFTTITGQVTNRSNAAIDNLMAVGIFKTSSDDVVKTAESMVDYQPLLPGQKSPFKVITSTNPAMTNCVVAFKQMFGGQIEADD